MLLLVDDTLGELDIDDHDRYWTESLSMPIPAVREITTNRTEADGAYDQTRFVGPRAVVASVLCLADDDGLQPVVDRMRAYLHPSRRFALVWECIGGGRRRLVVRVASHDVTYENPDHVVTTLGLVAPGGLIESDELHSVIIPATTSLQAEGRRYDLTFDRVYPAGGGAAGVAVVNAGSAPVFGWVARMYGPCTDPALENLTTGQSLVFGGYVERGYFIELDAAHRTALLNGDPTLSVYDRLDIAESSWWPLLPGTNMIRFRPFDAQEGAQAEIEWRDTWL